MSFSSEVKRELLQLDGQAAHCQAAELAAMLGAAGQVCRQENHMHIVLASENKQVVQKYARLLAQAAGISANITQECLPQQKNKLLYMADLFEEPDMKKLLQLLHIIIDEKTRLASALRHVYTDDNGHFRIPEETLDRLLEKTCCKRAFLRGAFLLSGSMSNPAKSYHFEIVCTDSARAGQIQKQFGSFGVEAKAVKRKNHEVVYVKEGAQIVDALNIMGAHSALMNLENVRIIKEMRNDINRRVNCEAANIHKTVNAAYRQQEAIRFLRRNGYLEGLPQQLQEIAALRMEYPEAPIKELGTLCQPPVGKSGVNHRLRKLEEIAEQQGYEKR